MAEQISFSLFDYFSPQQFPLEVPVINVIKSISEPSKHDEEAGRKNYVYDVGEELHGARKHLAALARFSLEWQKAIEEDPSQAFQLVSKDELLNDFKLDLLPDEGFTSEAAFAIKLIWDRVCQRPEDDPKQREYFIQAIGELRLRLSVAFTEPIIREVIDTLREDIRKARYSHYPLQLVKEPDLINYRYWLSLGDRFKSIFYSSSRHTPAGYRKIYERAFSSEEGKDWNWTQSKARSTNSTKKDNIERWERKVPDEVVRLSQEPSGVSKPEDLIEQYGFRGIQFGNWVEDAAGRYHVLCCGNALADLTALLEIPRKSGSLFGALGLAFGARGSGSAVAHYEPSTNVMNITKIRGGGSFAHEWSHGLDWNLYSYSYNKTNGKRESLTGHKPGNFLPYEVVNAFKDLMKEIKEGDGRIRVTVPDPLPREEGRYITSVVSYLKRNNYDVNAALMKLKDGNYRIKPKQWEDIGIMYCNILVQEKMEVPSEFFIPTDYSSFYLDATKRGAYWRRDHELFARAFEAWIEDELIERGMTNSYLVCGTRYSGPYPQGEERESINAAFCKWWKVLNSSGILHDELLWN
jgi:hypothetical protein